MVNRPWAASISRRALLPTVATICVMSSSSTQGEVERVDAGVQKAGGAEIFRDRPMSMKRHAPPPWLGGIAILQVPEHDVASRISSAH